ncbi:hypothetical protein [Salsipaludibacter albus]|uniref:hypothetical protein n=1 Tax=Salsipaludibacter albus TaxID=2849650 RepID=UPI001EE3B562|nr:hypothetical protein [Salsipaludibacter albus]MBY5162904.1 hypothetical protein [Salsipaludibacter albus]
MFLVVFLLLGCLYAATASWTSATTDPITNAITGWYMGNEGTLVLSQHAIMTDYVGTAGWVIDSPRGPVSQYPPGAAAVAGALYALSPGALDTVFVGLPTEDTVIPILWPPLWPAVLSAVLVTAAAGATVATTVARWSRSGLEAVLCGVLFGTATGAWSVASNLPWTHGPGMLMIAVGTWATSRHRWWIAGLAYGSAVLVRPHLAVVAAVVGIGLAVHLREWRPVILIGALSALGLAALLGYNYWLWSAVTMSGGYGGDFADLLLGSGPVWYLRNVTLGLLSPVNGLIIWAPFLLVLVPAVWRSRRQIPGWALMSALGGVAYLLVQWKANYYPGGDAFFAYRYPLEALTAAAPALWFGWDQWVRGHRTREKALFLTLALAITGQAVGALLS